MRVAVTMLARAPEPGRVKSRLAAAIGEAAACAVHAALMLDALEEAARWLAARGGPLLVLALDGSDGARRRLEETLEATPCRIESQPPEDLGERMRLALDRRLAEGCEASLVIGSDCPLVREALEAAAAALAGRDAALVPAEDGGFVLLGLRRRLVVGSLDGLPWGTSAALEATRLRLASLGLAPAVVGGAADVDDLAALQALAVRLDGEPPERAPRIRALMRGLAHRAADPGGIRDTIAR
jgi:rSAM/selenodomain-associated transferase 1